ncbi:MAG: hemolysin family protein [Erysipelotrichaceae bacterium]|nr:hemolysin family protein [Erysipelotrichaceae bacterium]
MNNNTMILVLIILVFLSSLFSSIETAFSSANRIRLKNLSEDNKEAKRALDILDDFDKFLSTILVGNNIVNIVATTIATVLFTRFFNDNGPTISTIVMTIVILVFGEVTPKSLAKKMPEVIAIKFSGFVKVLITLLTPFTFLFKLIKIVLDKFIKNDEDDSDITDELMTMVEEAENDGDLEAHESDLITAAIEFNDLDVRDILTPRVDLVAVGVDMDVDKIEETFRLNAFSRLPVYENSIDNIIGVIHEKDFYSLLYKNKEKINIKNIIKSTLYTSPHIKISTLLRQLQNSKLHLAVVLDEYGGTAGIITLEDILEELVGEIWDEHDTVKEFYTKISDTVYLVDGSVELSDVFERFDLDIDDNDFDYVTLSGWVRHQFEESPKAGDKFQYENLDILVTKADERKVNEVKITILKKVNED